MSKDKAIKQPPVLNYIGLINQFWQLDNERPFQASDTRLYFYLLHTCNKLLWKNPFGHSDRHLALQVDVSVNTIRKAKSRLMAAGLLDIKTPEKPSNSIAGQSLYTLLTVSKNDTVNKSTVSKNDTVCDTVCDTVYDTVYDTVCDTNNKLNQTKKNQTIFSENQKNNFELLFTDKQKQNVFYKDFKIVWDKLLLLPNWKNKTFDQLQETVKSFSGFDFRYINVKISDVIQAGYPMIKISKQDFENWASDNHILTDGNYYPGEPKPLKAFYPRPETKYDSGIYEDCPTLD